MEIRVDTSEFLGFFPYEGGHAGHRLPVELDQCRLALGIHQSERVDTESLHGTEGAGDGPIRHGPHQHVGGLGSEGGEVPEGVVGSLSLGNLTVRLRLGRVDQVGELDAILDEEDRHVIADQVPVALTGVETDGEAPDVSGCISRAPRPGDGREADEGGRVHARLAKDGRTRQVLDRLIETECPVSRRTARMHHTLRDALVIEVHDLLAQMEIIEQSGATLSDPQTVVGVIDWDAGGGRQRVPALGPLRGYRLLGRTAGNSGPPSAGARRRAVLRTGHDDHLSGMTTGSTWRTRFRQECPSGAAITKYPGPSTANLSAGSGSSKVSAADQQPQPTYLTQLVLD